MPTIYLIHFSKPLKHAQHYIGFTNNGDVFKRIEDHRKGIGAKICRAAVAEGIQLQLARVWYNVSRKTELKLKKFNGAKKFCPMCSGMEAYGRAIIKY